MVLKIKFVVVVAVVVFINTFTLVESSCGRWFELWNAQKKLCAIIVRRPQKKKGSTRTKNFIYVTHDYKESLARRALAN